MLHHPTMENDTCGYCGYVDNAKQQNPYNMDVNQQIIHTQVVQPQVVIANPTFSNGAVPGISRKSKTVALLLCIFLGVFGAHKFYVGKIGMGILYLFTVGLCGFGWIIDIVLIITGSFRDEFDLPLRD